MKTYTTDPTHITRIISDKGDPNEILIKEFGTTFKAYRDKWNRAEQCILVQEYPLHLDFELTFACNLRCKMCVNTIPPHERGYKTEPSKSISFDTFREIIDEGVSQGLSAITLNGNNEPLLKEDLVCYIRYARESGVLDIMLHSNGLALTKEKSKELLEAGLTKIFFSLDAINKSTYEKIRIGGDFDQVMVNINYFLQLKKEMKKTLPITRVSFVENKINSSEFDQFIDYWKDKIDFFTIQSFCNTRMGRSNYQELEEMFRLPAHKYVPHTICAQPYQRLFIRNNGEVLPCCHWFSMEHPVGNIYEQSVKEIWNGERMKHFRSRVNAACELQSEVCRRCRKSSLPQDYPYEWKLEPLQEAM